MTDRDQILADSTSLLKDDPRVAEAIVNPPPPGSRGATKLKALQSLITKQTPDMKAPPADPLGYLQKAIAIALSGKANRGVSLGTVIERTNPLDPLTRCYFHLRAINRAVRDLAEMQDKPAGYTDWSPSQREALGDMPCGIGRGLVYLGYRVDAADLLAALAGLKAIEQEISSADPRRPVVMACVEMVCRSLRQLRPHLVDAGNHQLEMLFLPDESGSFSIRIIERTEAEDSGDADAPVPQVEVERPPPLTALQALLLSLKAKIDQRFETGEWTGVSQAEAVHLVRTESAGLYHAATKANAVADVHLAIRRLVDRKKAAGSVAQEPSEATGDMPALCLGARQADPALPAFDRAGIGHDEDTPTEGGG